MLINRERPCAQTSGSDPGFAPLLGSIAALVCGGTSSLGDEGLTLPPRESAPERSEKTAQELLRGFKVLDRNDPCWQFVGRVCSAEGDLIGSCVLIEPTIALTAAHVVMESWESTRSSLAAHFGATVVPIREIIPCPGLRIDPPTQFTGEHVVGDLAIIHLDAPVATETLPVVTAESFPVRTREPIRLIGNSFDIMKITDDEALYSSGITHDVPESIPAYPFYANPSFGDSGGAVFDETGTLVGIMYRFILDPSGQVMEFSAVNIGYYREWIEATVERLRGEQRAEAITDLR